MKRMLLLPAVLLFAIGCKKEEVQKPKVIYKTAPAPKLELDTAEIQLADLPVEIPGTNVLLHPVGQYRVYDGSKRSGYSYERGSYTVSNYGEYEITGYLQNIMVQPKGADSTHAIFSIPVHIQSATFLKLHSDATNEQLFVYALSDRDTNQDGKLDANDVKALYLSHTSGRDLLKISPDLEEVIDWNYVNSRHRLYFRSIEDTNKNGAFDKDDKMHYNYLDLNQKPWEVKAYEPF